MPKELFGQDLVNELALGQRIAAGEKSVQGGLNITVEKLFEQIKAYLSDSEVITPDNTTVWDEYEVYPAGNVFVSYTNTSSPNPIFHDAAIYRSRVETPYGVSPEDDLYDIITNPTGKWEYQGQKVVVQEGGLSKVFFLNESEIQSVTGYIEGNNAVNLRDFKVYEYSSSATSGIKPNDNSDATGRWVEVGELGGGGGGLTPEQLEILEAFRASFSFSGLERFKQSFSLDLIIKSVVIAPNITELRVGKNAATPTDIMGQLPLKLSESDTLTFEATYNRESDSYFTLIGKKL